MNATLSFASMLPVAGWTGTAAKWAKQALKVSDNAFHSASGLIFKLGSRDGNRLSHIITHHTKDNLTRDYHGIFTINNGEIIENMNDAWQKVKTNNLAHTISPTGNWIYEVDMLKVIGKEGGSLGDGRSQTKMQIIVKPNTSEVVTAYPVR